MKKRILLCLLAGIILVGCGNTKEVDILTQPDNGVPTETVTPTTSEVREVSEPEVEFESIELSDSNITNSVGVVDMIAKSDGYSNVMFSPTSINFALGMLNDGAEGKTSELLSKYLGTDSYGDKMKSYLSRLDEFNSDDTINGYNTKLEIADAFWVSDKIKLNDKYRGTVENDYNALVDTVNFENKDETCSIINKWVDTKTNGLIKNIISSDLVKPDTAMCITNSVYFESAWSEPWNYHDYDKEKFTKFNGDKLDCYYMYTAGDAYYENDYATAFASNYVSDIKFIGILPKETGNFNIKDLDIEGLLKTKSKEYDELHVKMPKLNFETSVSLKPMFSALGLGVLFEDSAEFTGIADKSLKIDSIIQKTNLELDENGTRASAVTAVMMETCGAVAQDKKPIIREVYLDRPFAFLIYDEENDEVLFMGKVVTLDE